MGVIDLSHNTSTAQETKEIGQGGIQQTMKKAWVSGTKAVVKTPARYDHFTVTVCCVSFCVPIAQPLTPTFTHKQMSDGSRILLNGDGSCMHTNPATGACM